MRLLLIEDDRDIGEILQIGLNEVDFNVDWLTDGGLGVNAPDFTPYDAIILDLGLPHVDGMKLLADWRQRGLDVPVLILTARDSLPDRVNGLNTGADAYLCKPFDIEEVVAQLYAITRRNRGRINNTVQFGTLTINHASQSVQRHGEDVPLTKREYLLLDILLAEPERVYSRADIEERLYSWEQDVASNAVEVHVSNLRKKLGKRIIKTWRNVGYQLGDSDD